MNPEKHDEKPVKKSIPLRKRFRKFRRHLIKLLKSDDTILAMQFLFQLLFIYAGIAMLGLLVYYFMFQNYTYFLILSSLCGLMYISHLGVNIAHYDTIKSIFFYQAKSEDNLKSKALFIVKSISVILSQFIFLDIPIFYFQIISQKDDIESKLKKIIETEDKRKKQALKNKDKGKPEFEKQQQQQLQEFNTAFNDLKKQKKDRIQFLPNKFGCLSIFGFVPITFLINVWLCSKPHQIIVFPENQGVILIVALAFNITSAIIGLYEIQFFDKSAASLIDSIKWFSLRYLELLCKSLLIGYYIKFSEFQEVSLLIIGISYLTFSVFCTFLFTLFDYEKKVTVEQDQEQQPLKSEEQAEKLIEKGCFYFFKCYVKSLILNVYARTLYLPYKECALGMKTLSFFQVGYNASKKMVREEVACDGWKNLMITYDISTKSGIQRRTYTHIIQGLRFFELFHLALFCVCSNIIHGQYKEMVEPKQVQLYYSGKLISIVSIVILMLYYIRGGYRTIHEKQLDISSIDE